MTLKALFFWSWIHPKSKFLCLRGIWERLREEGEEEDRDETAGWHHQCNGHELGQTLGDGEGQRGLVCCIPWGCKELDMPGRLNNNKRHNHIP